MARRSSQSRKQGSYTASGARANRIKDRPLDFSTEGMPASRVFSEEEMLSRNSRRISNRLGGQFSSAEDAWNRSFSLTTHPGNSGRVPDSRSLVSIPSMRGIPVGPSEPLRTPRVAPNLPLALPPRSGVEAQKLFMAGLEGAQGGGDSFLSPVTPISKFIGKDPNSATSNPLYGETAQEFGAFTDESLGYSPLGIASTRSSPRDSSWMGKQGTYAKLLGRDISDPVVAGHAASQNPAVHDRFIRANHNRQTMRIAKGMSNGNSSFLPVINPQVGGATASQTQIPAGAGATIVPPANAGTAATPPPANAGTAAASRITTPFKRGDAKGSILNQIVGRSERMYKGKMIAGRGALGFLGQGFDVSKNQGLKKLIGGNRLSYGRAGLVAGLGMIAGSQALNMADRMRYGDMGGAALSAGMAGAAGYGAYRALTYKGAFSSHFRNAAKTLARNSRIASVAKNIRV